MWIKDSGFWHRWKHSTLWNMALVTLDSQSPTGFHIIFILRVKAKVLTLQGLSNPGHFFSIDSYHWEFPLLTACQPHRSLCSSRTGQGNAFQIFMIFGIQCLDPSAPFPYLCLTSSSYHTLKCHLPKSLPWPLYIKQHPVSPSPPLLLTSLYSSS